MFGRSKQTHTFEICTGVKLQLWKFQKIFFSLILLLYWTVNCKNSVGGVKKKFNTENLKATPVSTPTTQTTVEPGIGNDPDNPSGPGFSLESYVRPAFQDNNATSKNQAWCGCRESCGTCVSKPHVGKDYNSKSEPDISLAISTGTVKDIAMLSASCGYFILFEDSMGAQWYILHANKPTEISKGMKVPRAQILGKHSSFPSGGCGSGAHIHLERRTAGRHGGELKTKDCGRGSKSCNYDPSSLFEGKIDVTSESQRASLMQESQKIMNGGSMALNLDSREDFLQPPVEAPGNCSSLQGEAVAQSPNEVASAKTGETNEEEDVLEAVVTFAQTAENKFHIGVSDMYLRDKGIGNRNNLCDSSQCIVSYEIFSQPESKSWVKVLDSSGLQNQKIEISTESHLCITGVLGQEFLIQAKTNKGKIVEKWITIGE